MFIKFRALTESTPNTDMLLPSNRRRTRSVMKPWITDSTSMSHCNAEIQFVCIHGYQFKYFFTFTKQNTS